MHRPAITRIEYRFSRWPFFLIATLLMAGIAGLFLLQLDMLSRSLFLLCLVLLGMAQCLAIARPSVPALILGDGGLCVWLSDDLELPVEILPESFCSRFLIVLVLGEQAGRRRFCLWFARDNCSEADFRALSRQLRC